MRETPSPAAIVLPFSARGAVQGLEYGIYGTFVTAVASGVAAVLGAPAAVAGAAVVVIALGATATGYALGASRRPAER